MGHMSKKDWDAHVKAINGYNDDANQETIIFKRAIVTTSRYGEDNNLKYRDIELKGLVQYNYFRSWPVNQATDTGENDKESCMVYFNIEYLKTKNMLNEYNQLLMDPSMDRFIIAGVLYKPSGESQIAQASDKVLMFYIILKREEINTGNELYLPTQ